MKNETTHSPKPFASAQPRIPIEGIAVQSFQARHDCRGSLTEVFREDWNSGFRPLQWNAIHSFPGAIRGPHVHPIHADYQLLVHGRAFVALHDLRKASPTFDVRHTIWLDGDHLMSVLVPRGVLHTFLFTTVSVLMVGTDTHYDPADRFECLWTDPELQIDWPQPARLISERDQQASMLAVVRQKLEPHQAQLFGSVRSTRLPLDLDCSRRRETANA